MKQTISTVLAAIMLIAPQGAYAFSSAITAQELQDNLELVLPQASAIEGLEDHSNWQEVSRDETTYGVVATYQALYDDDFSLYTELPMIYMYVLSYSSSSELDSVFAGFFNKREFSTGEWVLLEQTATSFSYKTGAGSTSDLLLKNYSSESNTLHYVKKADNLLIVVNFYREGGQYNRGNVLAYENYILGYKNTLSVMKEAASYAQEAIDFYLDDIETLKGPDDYDYYVTSSSYSSDLSSVYSVPRNGSIELEIYLDENSEIGTVMDSIGIEVPEYGSISLGIDENAVLDFNLYDPYTASNCVDASGWHHIYSEESLDLYEWTKIKIEYGTATGMNIYVDDLLQSHCGASTSRSSGSLYLGDYPSDIIQESFVGYVKNIQTDYSLDVSGQTVDYVLGYSIFTDVPDNHEYAVAISYLKDLGIIEGYANGSFKPSQSINRVEILKMLLLGFGHDVPELTSNDVTPFDDVQAGSWYEKYVVAGYNLGVATGYPDGSFAPGDPVNKVEFLKILMNSYGIDVSDYAVTDIYSDTDESAWYAPYVQYSKDNGLMDDYSGYFYPDSDVSRGEVAETIYRMLTL
ncbi:hypothetical protein AUK45_02950 [Candidatus Peregrinibacteria bacterium CG2_30_44_17]|nr:MAG: hypothetical protein AUK45_02950 [Candidatus Peregrinibacteria bacterium CG2_30_44_17]